MLVNLLKWAGRLFWLAIVIAVLFGVGMVVLGWLRRVPVVGGIPAAVQGFVKSNE